MSYFLVQKLALKFAAKREILTDPEELDNMGSPNINDFEEKYSPKIKEKNYEEYFNTEPQVDHELDDYDPNLLLNNFNKFLKVHHGDG